MLFDEAVHPLEIPAGTGALEDVRFQLVCTSTDELKELFESTYKKVNTMTDEGYSRESILPFKQGLLEILVELRVRRIEADKQGRLYKSATVYPVPKIFAAARKRQVHLLKQLDLSSLQYLCKRTLRAAAAEAKLESNSFTPRYH